MAFPLECSTLGTGVDDRDWPFLRKVHFLARDESVMLGDVEHGFHGHSGIGGSRGTTLGYTKLGAKITKGHEHAPVIHDGVYGVGHISDDDHGYNHLPSGWSRANCVQYRDGKRSLLHIVRGRWHGETPRSSK
jgi:hypothetical protein